MRGEAHLIVSTMIILPTLMVLNNSTTSVYQSNAFILAAIGAMIGSLLPDVDASDSKVMHGAWRPIGLVSKYLFYKPITKLLSIKTESFLDEHRGYLHSFMGCLMATIFLATVLGLMFFTSTLFFSVPLELALLLWYLWSGIPIGLFLSRFVTTKLDVVRKEGEVILSVRMYVVLFSWLWFLILPFSMIYILEVIVYGIPTSYFLMNLGFILTAGYSLAFAIPVLLKYLLLLLHAKSIDSRVKLVEFRRGSGLIKRLQYMTLKVVPDSSDS